MTTFGDVNFLDRHGSTLAATAGAFFAGFAVLEAQGNDGLIAESLDVWYGQFVSPQWAGTVAVVAAVLTLIGLQIRKSPKLVAAAAITGSAVIGLPSFVDIAGNQALTINSVGAGLLLGSVGLVAAGKIRAQLGLGLGMVAAIVFKGALNAQLPADEGRWMVTVGGPAYVDSTVPIVVLVITAALLVTVALREAPLTDQLDAQSAIVMLALPFGFLLAYVYLGSYTSTTPMWILAAVIAVGFVVAASRLTDERDGNILLVGFAIAAASVSGLGWGPTSWWVAAIGVLALVGGAYLGIRRPSVRLGLGVLAAVTASGLLTGTDLFDAVPTVAYAVALPFGAGTAVASCMPVGVAASVVGPMIPLSMTLFSASAPKLPPQLVWSLGTSDDYVLPTVTMYSPLVISVVAATGAVAAAWFARYPRSPADTSS